MNAERKRSEDELRDEIHRLADQVQILRESVDELKTALEWAIRSVAANSRPPSPLGKRLLASGSSDELLSEFPRHCLAILCYRTR